MAKPSLLKSAEAMQRDGFKRNDSVVLAALLVFTLAFRYLTLMIFHTGIDEGDYWYAAKALANGLPYPELTHRTVRWAVILPVAAAQKIFGSAPAVYYLLPVLNTLVQVALAWKLGRSLRGTATGFLAAFALVLFPYMVRAGSQVRPEIFSMTYLLFAIDALAGYMEEIPTATRRRRLIAMVVWLFIAYEAKITNLFYLPGFIIALWAFKRRPKDAVTLSAALFCLFLFETGLYAFFTEYKTGQLGVIAANHLADTEVQIENMRLLDLFRRYSPEYLQTYWQLPFALFALLGILYLVRSEDKRLKALIVSAASFFFFLTFAVGGLSPLKPAEAFINRYFCAALGPVFLVLAYATEGLFSRVGGGPILRRSGVLISVLGLTVVLTAGLFSFKSALPKSVREYANAPLAMSEHPLFLGERYRAEANAGYENGIPILAEDSLGGDNALRAAAWFLIDVDNYADGSPPIKRRITVDGRDYLYLAKSPLTELPDEIMAVVRSPFRMKNLRRESIGKLGPDKFPSI
jgi:4-amino-4-deoxy-L-arabinose transferase-like glycosyltransferase